MTIREKIEIYGLLKYALGIQYEGMVNPPPEQDEIDDYNGRRDTVIKLLRRWNFTDNAINDLPKI